MPFTFTNVQITGTADTFDERQAVKVQLAQENARRAASEPPLPPLPTSTGAERKTSYEQMFKDLNQRVHASYVQQTKESITRQELWQKYEAASQATKDSINTTLGLTIP